MAYLNVWKVTCLGSTMFYLNLERSNWCQFVPKFYKIKTSKDYSRLKAFNVVVALVLCNKIYFNYSLLHNFYICSVQTYLVLFAFSLTLVSIIFFLTWSPCVIFKLLCCFSDGALRWLHAVRQMTSCRWPA